MWKKDTFAEYIRIWHYIENVQKKI